MFAEIFLGLSAFAFSGWLANCLELYDCPVADWPQHLT
jgi:hypothetical protein